MTIDEFRKIQSAKSAKTNKYGALRSGGYASGKEHARALELALLQQAGEISQLRQQVRYELLPAQRDSAGTLIERPCSYVADFVYFDRDNNLVVEDTKGFKTRDYIIKRKLMLFVHGIRIHEV